MSTKLLRLDGYVWCDEIGDIHETGLNINYRVCTQDENLHRPVYVRKRKGDAISIAVEVTA